MDPAAESLHALTPEDLKRQDRWLRSLVRGLVAESEVDDVVQQTWFAAVARGGGGSGSRAWLATVAKRLSFRVHRGRQRRADRENQAAKQESVPGAAEAWDLLELQQNVLDAVKKMREPYATPLLLRYVHGHSVAQVAESLGVEEAAVRQRIKRGIDQLRADVGARYEEDWRSLPALTAWLGIGTYTMKKSSMVALGVLLIGALSVSTILVVRSSSESEQRNSSAALVGIARESEPAPLVELDVADGERTALAMATEEAVAVPETAVRRGIALAPDGQLLTGVELGLLPKALRRVPTGGVPRPEAHWTTDGVGGFHVDGLQDTRRITPTGRLVRVASDVTWAEDVPARLIFAPAVHMDIYVRSEDGIPLDDVSVTLDDIELKGLPQSQEGITIVDWGPWTTDAAGLVRLVDLPASMGSLRFSKAGYVAHRIPVPGADEAGEEIVLATDPLRYTLRGWVIDPRGGSVQGARVGLGNRTTSSAADGSFEIRILASEEEPRRDDLWATGEPWRGVLSRGIGRQLVEAESGELEVKLIFEGEPLRIAGRILLPDGQPYAGMLVFPWYQEHVANEASIEELGAAGDGPELRFGPGLRVWAVTDDEGRFELGGLQDREYTLHLVDKERHLSGKTDPVRAGEMDWLWTVPETFELEALEGRVVDRHGRGVGGVKLKSMYLTYFSDRGSEARGGEASATTDGEGRFVLRGVPGAGLMIQMSGKGILFGNYSVKQDELHGTLTIPVEREASIQIELTGERLQATGFQILDGSGQSMMLLAMGGGEFGWSGYRLIKDGKTRVINVGDSAATLVLFRHPNDELGRLPLQLTGEGVEQIVW